MQYEIHYFCAEERLKKKIIKELRWQRITVAVLDQCKERTIVYTTIYMLLLQYLTLKQQEKEKLFCKPKGSKETIKVFNTIHVILKCS